MKKLLALMLAAVLALSLVACGGGEKNTTKTKEEMEAEAVAISDIVEFSEIINSTSRYSDSDYREIYAVKAKYEENPLVFASEYIDKVYYLSGYVGDISDDRFVLKVYPDNIANSDALMRVYPAEQDELLKIKKDELITIVGTLVEKENQNNDKYICFESAYIV